MLIPPLLKVLSLNIVGKSGIREGLVKNADEMNFGLKWEAECCVYG
jgi:hypothetical protein